MAARKGPRVQVEFIRSNAPWIKGDRAGFTPAEADRLVNGGKAVYTNRQMTTEPGKGTPNPQGPGGPDKGAGPAAGGAGKDAKGDGGKPGDAKPVGRGRDRPKLD